MGAILGLAGAGIGAIDRPTVSSGRPRSSKRWKTTSLAAARWANFPTCHTVPTATQALLAWRWWTRVVPLPAASTWKPCCSLRHHTGGPRASASKTLPQTHAEAGLPRPIVYPPPPCASRPASGCKVLGAGASEGSSLGGPPAETRQVATGGRVCAEWRCPDSGRLPARDQPSLMLLRHATGQDLI